MEDLTMFERLLTLPLFQCMTMQEMAEAFSHVRLDFAHFQAGDEIVSQNDPCRDLICVISGELSSCYRDENSPFILRENLPQVRVIEPYNMFGMLQKYSRDYAFQTEGVTLTIERKVMLNHLLNSTIVKINMLNIVSNRFHQAQRVLFDMRNDTVEQKIIKFIHSYSSEPKGHKELNIKMRDLADIIQETRLNVSRTLNDMQDRGLIVLQRGSIEIPEIKDLKKSII